jgi:uncharacterized membrane protein
MPLPEHINALTVVLLVAILVVTRWRTVVRLLTAVVATGVITALGSA